MIRPAGDSPRIRREPSPAQNDPPRSAPAGAGPAPGPPAGSAGGPSAAGRAPPGARFAALGRAGILVTVLASPVGSGDGHADGNGATAGCAQARRHHSPPRGICGRLGLDPTRGPGTIDP